MMGRIPPKNWNGQRWVDAPTTDCSKDKILTVQAPASELNINSIVARILKGGTAPVYGGKPFYGDVSEFDGLQDAYIKIQEAEDLFMQFPAEVREKFDNDPVKFVEFFEDPKNREEAIKLGFIDRPQATESAPSPVTPVPEK